LKWAAANVLATSNCTPIIAHRPNLLFPLAPSVAERNAPPAAPPATAVWKWEESGAWFPYTVAESAAIERVYSSVGGVRELVFGRYKVSASGSIGWAGACEEKLAVVTFFFCGVRIPTGSGSGL
jgi:hypothetical protein